MALIFLIIVALMSVGGIPIFSSREKYLDNEIKIELVDKKRDESDEELKDLE